MKLKYYLRGLGIGIVVTAIIMSIVKKPETLTDAQIKMRALELGMVEENVLADLAKDKEDETQSFVESKLEDQDSVETVQETEEDNLQENEDVIVGEEEQEEKVSQEVVPEDLEVAEVDTTEESLVTEEVVEESVDAEEQKEETIDNNIEEAVENYIIINVEKGNGSEVVSQRLFEAGLVNSSKEFNRFLVQNGYDRKLKVGHHEIPAGATEEEMAKILCGIK